MTTYINATHGTLSGANKPLCFDEITAKQYGANSTKAQSKTVERELKALHKAGLLEFTPGRAGVPYYRLTTPAVPTEPQPKPSATAVAVHAAIEGDTDPAPGIAEQLRQAHAERLAMSQTIISICCAIGRDPGQTTTAELQQAVKDAITEARNGAAHEMAVVLGNIRKAIGDNTDRIALNNLADHIANERNNMLSDWRYFVGHLDAIRPIAEELLAGHVAATSPGEAVQIMAQLIEAQHAHLHAQSVQIESLTNKLEIASRAAEHHEQQIKDLRLHAAQKAIQHQAASEHSDEVIALLQAEREHLRSQIRDAKTAPVSGTPTPDAFFVLRHDWKRHVSRHKSREAAERTATSALRAGAGQADIYAVKRIAIGKRHPVIKSV